MYIIYHWEIEQLLKLSHQYTQEIASSICEHQQVGIIGIALVAYFGEAVGGGQHLEAQPGSFPGHQRLRGMCLEAVERGAGQGCGGARTLAGVCLRPVAGPEHTLCHIPASLTPVRSRNCMNCIDQENDKSFETLLVSLQDVHRFCRYGIAVDRLAHKKLI